MKRSILVLGTAALLTLVACGDSSSGSTKKMNVRQQDTSKQAGAPSADAGTMKMQEGQKP
jgi:hypothetical protein